MQQVNLYVESLRPKKEYLTLLHMLIIFVFITVLLAAATVWMKSASHKWEDKLASKSKIKTQMLEQTKLLEVKVKGLVVDISLQNLNERLSKRVAANRMLAKTIDGVIKVNQGQFSKLMMALARQYITGISLSNIVFDQGGVDIALTGNASSAEKVPEYLQRLRKEPLFVGRTFKAFTVEKQKEKRSLIFHLGTQNAVSENALERFVSGRRR